MGGKINLSSQGHLIYRLRTAWTATKIAGALKVSKKILAISTLLKEGLMAASVRRTGC